MTLVVIASLVIAILIWFIAKTEANPIEQRLFTRPITILVDDTMIIKSYSDERQVQFIYNKGTSNMKVSSATDPVISVAEPTINVAKTIANLTVSDCKGNSKILIQDSGLPAPTAGSLTINCSSTVGGHQSSVLTPGANTVDIYLGDGTTTVVGPFQVNINHTP